MLLMKNDVGNLQDSYKILFLNVSQLNALMPPMGSVVLTQQPVWHGKTARGVTFSIDNISNPHTYNVEKFHISIWSFFQFSILCYILHMGIFTVKI